jgi:nucleoside 2-deoxyribosyltransferase
MMPFAAEFDDVYEAIRRAVATVDDGLELIRLDEVRAAGRISDDMVEELTTCSLCIADVSGSNPNVMWEVGFATALKKPVIVINQVTERLPFDIADVRTVIYDRSALSKSLPDALAAAVSQR